MSKHLEKIIGKSAKCADHVASFGVTRKYAVLSIPGSDEIEEIISSVE